MNAIPTYLPTYSSLEKEKVGDDDADLTLVIPCGGGGGFTPSERTSRWPLGRGRNGETGGTGDFGGLV